jgi:pilus assembly protein TadC
MYTSLLSFLDLLPQGIYFFSLVLGGLGFLVIPYILAILFLRLKQPEARNQSQAKEVKGPIVEASKEASG